VFATSIQHSKHICAQFRFHGIAAEHLDCFSTPEERKEILDRLRDGSTRVVCNCAVLAEGFDLPALDCMILARPTKSLIRYLQMAGRVLRPDEGKTSALVLDHSDTVINLGFPTDDLPLMLDDGRPKVKADPKPKLHSCPHCKAVSRRKPNPCNACGYAPPPPPLKVAQVEGSLHEITRVVATRHEQQAYYSQLVSICESRNYSRGWVAHKYREHFGVWPPKPELLWQAAPPSHELERELLAARIRWAKQQEAQKRMNGYGSAPR
jgi:superfamily II DNA or RNA helicase